MEFLYHADIGNTNCSSVNTRLAKIPALTGSYFLTYKEYITEKIGLFPIWSGFSRS